MEGGNRKKILEKYIKNIHINPFYNKSNRWLSPTTGFEF